jgi:hypothetical protein
MSETEVSYFKFGKECTREEWLAEPDDDELREIERAQSESADLREFLHVRD